MTDVICCYQCMKKIDADEGEEVFYNTDGESLCEECWIQCDNKA